MSGADLEEISSGGTKLEWAAIQNFQEIFFKLREI
jgi:hypothetical protein